MRLNRITLLIAIFTFPLFAFAASGAPDDVSGLLTKIQVLLNMIIPIIITLAVIYFFWGLTIYITKASEEKERGRDIMIYGIISIFIMVSVWGFIGILQSSLVGKGTAIEVPTLAP